MNQLARISPVSDAEAGRLARPGTLAELGERITAQSAAKDGAGRVVSGGQARKEKRRRRWVVGVPLAAVLAVALLVVTWLGRPGQRVGPVVVGPPAAQALSFTRHGRYVTVIVRNPLAGPAAYRAELARHHLRITLRLLPVSPSLVGTVVYIGQSGGADITPITARGRCWTGGGGSACPVGVRIPAGFLGTAQIVFGRAARPGERYASTTSAFAPGEVMHGMRVRGLTVAQVLALLRARRVTVPVFNYMREGVARNRPHVPGGWYVYDALPWAPQQVMLFVGPGRNPPPTGAGRPVPSGAPSPSPSPVG
jgi:hypothetical protein